MKKTFRHRSREIAVETLYSLDFNGNLPPKSSFTIPPCLDNDEEKEEDKEVIIYAEYLVSGTIENLEEIDTLISKYSTYPFSEIQLLDKALLRVALFSLLYSDDERSILIIDEFVKVDREFDGGSSYKFINGILDSIYKDKINDNTKK